MSPQYDNVSPREANFDQGIYRPPAGQGYNQQPNNHGGYGGSPAYEGSPVYDAPQGITGGPHGPGGYQGNPQGGYDRGRGRGFKRGGGRGRGRRGGFSGQGGGPNRQFW